MDRMARKVHRDRKTSGPGHKVRRAQRVRVRKVRIDRLCGSSVHILDQVGLAKPLRFAYPAVRLEITLGFLEIWKSPPPCLRRVAHSRVRDKNRAVPAPAESQLTHGSEPAQAHPDKANRQRCYRNRLHPDIFRRCYVRVPRRRFEEV
jgi:hypothetical protein